MLQCIDQEKSELFQSLVQELEGVEFEPANFSTLPVELFLKITSYLPTSAFLPLLQTSHAIRHLFTVNHIRIVNSNILTRFPLSSSVLGTQPLFPDGLSWVIPTHESIFFQEKYLELSQRQQTPTRRKCHLNPIMLIRNSNIISRHFYTPKSTSPKQPLRLSSPGPQYLHFLEECDTQIQIRHQLSTNSDQNSFSFTLGTYIIAPFLSRLNNQSPPDLFQSLTHKAKTSRQPLLFGEMPPSPTSEKPERVDARAAMLWYYGNTGVLNCPLREEDRLGKNVKIGVIQRMKDKFGKKMSKVVHSAVRPFKHCLPVRNGFESLR